MTTDADHHRYCDGTACTVEWCECPCHDAPRYIPADPRLLFQTEVWVDRHDVTHKLEEMNPHHRATLIPFLHDNAEDLYLWYLFDRNGTPHTSYDEHAWLDQTPLVRRLRALDTRGPLQRRMTALRNGAWRLLHPRHPS
jgi:hypothetical protein